MTEAGRREVRLGKESEPHVWKLALARLNAKLATHPNMVIKGSTDRSFAEYAVE